MRLITAPRCYVDLGGLCIIFIFIFCCRFLKGEEESLESGITFFVVGESCWRENGVFNFSNSYLLSGN